MTLLSLLRNESVQFHREIHNNKFAKKILDKTISAEEFKDYLIKLYSIYKPIETAFLEFEEWGAFEVDIEKRLKTSDLIKDLENLGLKQDEINAIQIENNLPKLNHFDDVVGVFYVLEGIKLGGCIVARIIHSIPHIQLQQPLYFFDGNEEIIKENWKDSCRFIEEYGETTNKQEAIVEAAQETFIKLNNCLMKDNHTTIKK
jgi:heme oxygenase